MALDKNTIRYITQNISNEEAKYVAGIRSTLDDSKILIDSMQDDVIFITKIMAFADKFKALHWSAPTLSYHNAIDGFTKEIEKYKDDIAENIQSIIGQMEGNTITKLELPIGDDPLQIINEVKICVNNWFELHKDDMEYEGCRNITSGFIEAIHKYIYLFRMCKCN